MQLGDIPLFSVIENKGTKYWVMAQRTTTTELMSETGDTLNPEKDCEVDVLWFSEETSPVPQHFYTVQVSR